MPLKLTFHADDNTEDQVYDAVAAANARYQFEMTDREYEALIDKKVDEAYESLGKFLEDDCCLAIEFDFATGTAVVKDRTH